MAEVENLRKSFTVPEDLNSSTALRNAQFVQWRSRYCGAPRRRDNPLVSTFSKLELSGEHTRPRRRG